MSTGDAHDGESGKMQLRRAVALSFAARLSGAVVTLATSMVIARLLTPAEIGVYAIGLSLKALLESLRDFGVGNYLVQEKHLTPDKVRAAFSITLLFGWCAGTLLIIASRPTATFYRAPILMEVMSVLAINFFLLPFGAPALALLRREFRFGALYGITVGATVLSAIVAVGLAMSGFGPLSIAWASVAEAVSFTVGASLSQPGYAMVIPTLKGWRPILAFGGQSTFAGIIVQLSESAVQLLIGRVAGFNALGLFSRAYGLVLNARASLFGPLYNVAFPVLAANIRAGRDIRESYVRASGLLTGVVWPIETFLILMAFPVFRVLYGQRWDAAIPLFRILLVGDMAYEALAFIGPLLLAFGRVDYLAAGEARVQGARLAMIVPAAFYSITAVCVAEVLHYGFFLVIFGRISLRLVDLSLRRIAEVQMKSMLLALCSSIGPGLSALFFGFSPDRPWPALSLATAGAAIGWLSGIYLLKHDLRSEIGRARDLLTRAVFQVSR